MLGKFLRRPMDAYPARVQEIGVITAFQRELHVLFDKQDGDPGFRKIENDVEDLVDDFRCKAKRRFVQHQQLRFGHQRPADGEHLLLAARHPACHTVAAFLQDREKFEHLVAKGFEAPAAASDMGCNEIFLDRQPLENLPAFRAMRETHAHDLFRPCAGNILAVELDRSRGCARNTGNRIQQGCLAGTVRPENDDDLALVDFQVDGVKYADAPVSRVEPGDL